ncbi:substrate-binding periplasmic protein [Parathalassolituus penaei]|uniref:Transporter substrate-binding domain-containing protein n=1 Tax=Parathalassolituus penaei TaxID=2997323 RepID=A0A9X3EBJ9_9GAMM|nr:transporter substrate-binding domain-containing protein [Parathalassolituus penaei]MCY0963715.1 transporter substrate-binding domain-containing protein [Parathalassolituus penaei]
MSDLQKVPGKQRSASITSLLVILLCLPLLSNARSLDDVQASGVVSVAVYRDFPPYSWEDNGVAKGIDVEIARAIAKSLNVQLQLHWMVPDESLDDDLRNHVWKGHYLARVEDGSMLKFDVADVMLRVPYDREYAFKVDQDGRVINDLVHFFAPYQKESWALTIDNQQVESIENLARFQYDKVGVEIDSLPDFYLSGAFRGMLRNNVVHFTTTQDAMNAMGKGEVAGVMGTKSQVMWGVTQFENPGQYVLADIPFPNLVTPVWEVGMAVKDDHRDLAYAVEDAVTEMVHSGRMADVFKEYGTAYTPSSLFETK